MIKPLFTVTTILSGIFAMAAATSLQAAELKVIAGGSMTASINAIAPQFEKATGHKLVIHFNSTPNIIARINSGTPFDVVVVPVDVFKDAAAKARFAPGPTVDIARVGYGVDRPRRRAEARHLDAGRIQEGFARRALDCLPADRARPAPTSRKCSSASALLRKMKAKTKVQAAPGAIAPAVAKGEAELGVFLTNVLIAPGVELVGPFPGDLQQELVFTSAVAADTKEADAAQSIDRLSARRRPPPPSSKPPA